MECITNWVSEKIVWKIRIIYMMHRIRYSKQRKNNVNTICVWSVEEKYIQTPPLAANLLSNANFLLGLQYKQ